MRVEHKECLCSVEFKVMLQGGRDGLEYLGETFKKQDHQKVLKRSVEKIGYKHVLRDLKTMIEKKKGLLRL